MADQPLAKAAHDQKVVEIIELADAAQQAAAKTIAEQAAVIQKQAAIIESWQKVAAQVPVIVDELVAFDRIVNDPAAREKVASIATKSPEDLVTLVRKWIDPANVVSASRLGGPDKNSLAKEASQQARTPQSNAVEKASETFNRIFHGNGQSIR